MKRWFWTTVAMFSMAALVGCVAPGTTGDDDDDDDSPEVTDLATKVAGTYVGDAVINLWPSEGYELTVTRVGSNEVQMTGEDFEATVTLQELDGTYVNVSGAGAVEFDPGMSPMTLEFAIGVDTFDGVKQ